MHIISVTDFPLFCSNSARKCLILPAECSPQISLILPAEFIQAYFSIVFLCTGAPARLTEMAFLLLALNLRLFGPGCTGITFVHFCHTSEKM